MLGRPQVGEVLAQYLDLHGPVGIAFAQGDHLDKVDRDVVGTTAQGFFVDKLDQGVVDKIVQGDHLVGMVALVVADHTKVVVVVAHVDDDLVVVGHTQQGNCVGSVDSASEKYSLLYQILPKKV